MSRLEAQVARYSTSFTWLQIQYSLLFSKPKSLRLKYIYKGGSKTFYIVYLLECHVLEKSLWLRLWLRRLHIQYTYISSTMSEIVQNFLTFLIHYKRIVNLYFSSVLFSFFFTCYIVKSDKMYKKIFCYKDVKRYYE